MNLMEASPIKKTELDELEAYIREYRKKQERGSRDRNDAGSYGPRLFA